MESTDIARHSLDKLKKSKVKKVTIIGRRGPAQAAFTIKEFREMCKLDNVSVEFCERDMNQFHKDMQFFNEKGAKFNNKRAKDRILKLIEDTYENSKTRPKSTGKYIYIHTYMQCLHTSIYIYI